MTISLRRIVCWCFIVVVCCYSLMNRVHENQSDLQPTRSDPKDMRQDRYVSRPEPWGTPDSRSTQVRLRFWFSFSPCTPSRKVPLPFFCSPLCIWRILDPMDLHWNDIVNSVICNVVFQSFCMRRWNNSPWLFSVSFPVLSSLPTSWHRFLWDGVRPNL